MQVLSNRLDAGKIFDTQTYQYSEVLYLADTVTASTEKMGRATVSNLGHFFCLYITGSMTTQYNSGAGAADTGIDYLRGQLRDGSNNRPLFSDFIPLHLLLSPGRRKSLAASGSDSQTLFYPLSFEYLFPANSDILITVKNDSNVDNSYSIALHGVRVLASSSVRGA